MYFFIYKTTNTITGEYYLGKHQTKNLNDGYLGSGIVLKNKIKKYGKEAFIREILYFCEDEESLNALEQVIVNEEIVIDKNSYNLTTGGKGGCIALFKENPKYESIIEKFRIRRQADRSKYQQRALERHKNPLLKFIS